MSSNKSIPFTYLIGWPEINKWYYGVRYSKKCHPNDLWKKYFTSSNKVKKMRKTHGEPSIIEIRKIFDDPKKALEYEQKVLKKLKVKTNEKWINVAIGQPSMEGKKHSEKTKNKMRKPKPKGFGDKVRSFHFGKKRTEEWRKNISLSKRGLALRSKIWKFILNGVEIDIFNLKKYCRENNLNISCMSDVYYGRQKQHHNYRAKK